MLWENIVGTLAGDWRYNVKPALIDGFRNPDPVTMAVIAALQTRHEKKLAPLHPAPHHQTPESGVAVSSHSAPQSQKPEAVVAAPHARPATKKKRSQRTLARGRICVQIKDEMKQIRYMTREGGRTMKEIRTARPDFRFWDLVESDALSDEDRELALHPNRWEPGYSALLLGKFFKVSKMTIRDYITAYNRPGKAGRENRVFRCLRALLGTPSATRHLAPTDGH